MGTVNGYTVQGPWRTSATGKYAFAVKNGHEYFIKNISSHKYPNPERFLDNHEGFEKRKRICEEWFAERSAVNKAVNRAADNCRFIVPPKELFLVEPLYYTVSVRVREKPLTPEEIYALDLDRKMQLLSDFADALSALAEQKIIHGDLKPANVLIVRCGDRIEPRFIDFEDSYFNSRPPRPEDTVGSMEYYSPELMRYVVSGLDGGTADPRTVTCRSDIFSAGLMFHEYFLCESVRRNRCKYPCQATRPSDLTVGRFSGSTAEVGKLIRNMLVLDFNERADIGRVRDDIATIRSGGTVELLKNAGIPDEGATAKGAYVPGPAPDTPAPAVPHPTEVSRFVFTELSSGKWRITRPDGSTSLAAAFVAKTIAERNGIYVPGLTEGGTSLSAPPEGRPVQGPLKGRLVTDLGNGRVVIGYPDGRTATVPLFVYKDLKNRGVVD